MHDCISFSFLEPESRIKNIKIKDTASHPQATVDELKASVMSLRLGAGSPGIKKATSTHSLNGNFIIVALTTFTIYCDDLYLIRVPLNLTQYLVMPLTVRNHTFFYFVRFSLCSNFIHVLVFFYYAALPTPPANRKESSHSAQNQTADDR